MDIFRPDDKEMDAMLKQTMREFGIRPMNPKDANKPVKDIDCWSMSIPVSEKPRKGPAITRRFLTWWFGLDLWKRFKR